MSPPLLIRTSVLLVSGTTLITSFHLSYLTEGLMYSPTRTSTYGFEENMIQSTTENNGLLSAVHYHLSLVTNIKEWER